MYPCSLPRPAPRAMPRDPADPHRHPPTRSAFSNYSRGAGKVVRRVRRAAVAAECADYSRDFRRRRGREGTGGGNFAALKSVRLDE